jgi:hypothetical protein
MLGISEFAHLKVFACRFIRVTRVRVGLINSHANKTNKSHEDRWPSFIVITHLSRLSHFCLFLPKSSYSLTQFSSLQNPELAYSTITSGIPIFVNNNR